MGGVKAGVKGGVSVSVEAVLVPGARFPRAVVINAELYPDIIRATAVET